MKRGNEFYSVEYNNEKNRIYFSMTGDVTSVNVVSNFESDWKLTVSESKQGFTILGDLSKSGKLSPEFEALNTKVQGWLMEQGCRKVAQLIGDLNVMSQVNAFADKSGMRNVLRAFNFEKTAEIWLNMQ
jgi:hypothetical protein